jgi:hypothetical protein
MVPYPYCRIAVGHCGAPGTDFLVCFLETTYAKAIKQEVDVAL